ncbi:MAG: ABC transporter substrate-binding protein [Lachnospiraceae bacterium]|jgi:raffinose/stachyose/melibiose transport system substrate-binding protein|nr:ABC transporter substrate-binding protein [Lachnospiraceae bacterium]
MKMKKIMAVLLSTAMVATLMVGCGSKKSSDDAKGKVYYLNFKPEVAEQWTKIAKAYTKETGVEVKVETAASGQYETKLKSEIAKTDAPTMFQINGPVGLESWKDYCADLTDSDLYKNLSDQNMAVKKDGKVYGIPYVVEGYGIIYNKAIMDKYFALSDQKSGIKSTDEIKDFATLKKVADDMQSKKTELGIKGVFSSTSFAPGEDWRWQTHLANLPVYYEYKDANVSDMKDLTFKYNKEFKNIFDLYLDDSTTKAGLLGSKTVEDSMAEFALGQSAMVQNGNWGWSQVSGTKGNVVKAEDVKFMPIYTGMPDDAKQGLCIGTENYWCINAKASKADQKATMDFMNWLTSGKGKSQMTKLGFISPFKTFTDAEQPDDPLAKEVVSYMNNKDLTSVSWNFTTFPSQAFKDAFGQNLLKYAQGQMKWNTVVKDMVADWAKEKAAAAE